MCAKVDKLFEKLLDNKEINLYNRKRVMDICRDWYNINQSKSKLGKLFIMKYKPYLLKDVYAGEALNKFRVISTFVGGGGSSTGYRLAGGKILAINEFVEEAKKYLQR